MKQRLNTSIGLIGLPNVGKSSLFNLLSKSTTSLVANYPFSTLDPVVAFCPIVDPRLLDLGKKSKAQRIVYDGIELHDIAGLIKGASQGSGLGNAFLGQIRNVDGLVHVVRCFEDDAVIHVDGEGRMPERDIETIDLELIFADLEVIERRLEKRGKISKEEKIDLEIIYAALLEKKSAASVRSELKMGMPQGLLTSKPVAYALVTDHPLGNEITERVSKSLGSASCSFLVCTSIEHQISQETDLNAQKELMEAFNIKETTSTRFARCVANLLQRRVFFTAGPMEARAWAIGNHETAVEAASRIHTDIGNRFVCAEVIPWNEWGEVNSKKRMEGATYIVQDGDVIIFRHNAKSI